MSRYIDADVFREFLGDIRAEYNFFDDEERPRYEAYSKALLILNEYIENVPSIGIVRCKECRFTQERATTIDGKKYCGKLIGWVNADDFCSYGERKESE